MRCQCLKKGGQCTRECTTKEGQDYKYCRQHQQCKSLVSKVKEPLVPEIVRTRVMQGSTMKYNTYEDEDESEDDEKVSELLKYKFSLLDPYRDRYKDNIYLTGNLTPSEEEAIENYVGLFYKSINNYLRGILKSNYSLERIEYIKTQIHNLQGIFYKTRKLEEDLYVFRGMKLPVGEMEKIYKKGEMQFNNFVSTTTHFFKTLSKRNFSDAFCCVYIIKVPAGTPVIFINMEKYTEIIKLYGSILNGYEKSRSAHHDTHNRTKKLIDYIHEILVEGEVLLPWNSKLVFTGKSKLGDFGGDIDPDMNVYHGTFLNNTQVEK